jgi:hypothetical protein
MRQPEGRRSRRRRAVVAGSAAELFDAGRRELRALEELRIRQSEIAARIAEIERESGAVSELQAELRASRQAAVEAGSALQAQAAEAEAAEAAAARSLRQAQAGLAKMDHRGLAELKRMRHPPLSVRVGVRAVCVVLGEEDGGGGSARVAGVLARPMVLRARMQTLDARRVPEGRVHAAARLLSEAGVSEASAARECRACVPLVRWLEAVVRSAVSAMRRRRRRRPLSTVSEPLGGVS